jgi:AcrR family transcriptional regulator
MRIRKRGEPRTGGVSAPPRAPILAAAMQVFARCGVENTRVEDILIAANVARRTFYKYFRSKQDVLAALYEDTTAELLRSIAAARAQDPGSPLASLHRGIDTYLDFHHDIANLRELIELGLSSSSLLAPRRRWLRDELVRMLDAAVRELDGRRLDPLVFYALLSALEGVSLQVLDDGAKPTDIERARKVAHALLDQVIGAPSGRALPGRQRAAD